MKVRMNSISLLGLAAAALLASGCAPVASDGTGGGASATKALTISGSFASLPSLLGAQPLYGYQLVPMAASSVKVRCVTLAGPLLAGEGEVSTSSPYGFSLNMSVGLNAPIGCFVLADDSIVATLSFGSGSGMDGTSKAKTAYSPKPDSTTMALGTISVTNGLATPSAVTENGTGAKPSFDNMTGQWKLTSFYVNADENYLHPCDNDYDQTEDPDMNAACKATWANKGLYVKQFSATKDGEPTRNGLALWDSESARTACGDMEGVDLEAGWTAVGWTPGPITYAAVDMSNIDAVVLSNARFHKSTGSNNMTNCPKDDGGMDEIGTIAPVQSCATATKCSDFDFASISDGTRRSGEKARCVANSLASGSDFGYLWNNVCGPRADVNWANGAFASSGYKSDGSGCVDGTCDSISFQDVSPQSRLFMAEMFIDGNVGTATQYGNESCGGGSNNLNRSTSITATQTSATTATLVVEQTMVFSDSATPGQKALCLQETWIQKSLGKVTRMKLNLQKQ